MLIEKIEESQFSRSPNSDIVKLERSCRYFRSIKCGLDVNTRLVSGCDLLYPRIHFYLNTRYKTETYNLKPVYRVSARICPVIVISMTYSVFAAAVLTRIERLSLLSFISSNILPFTHLDRFRNVKHATIIVAVKIFAYRL